ncbi:uncharacterized protein LOC141686242 [Apium graveolens]|uniref:uncharacterized protein LOC141686242 n=1 Tax=Apium graveolens TaxID=4045 RepID=UPI003D7B6CEA
MHVEKNVCDNIIGTLLHMKFKSKDSRASRLDLVDMGIRPDLAPEVGEKRTYLPPAPYTLSRKEKQIILTSLYDMKLPYGHASNIRNCVSMIDMKLYGLKSHDCHILLQQLLPVCIRSVLPKNVRSYVRNRFYPEGFIAEGYLKEESIEFCSEFYSGSSRTTGLPKDEEKISGPIGGVTMKSVAEKERDEAHLSVLRNNSEVEPYVMLHKNIWKRFIEGKRRVYSGYWESTIDNLPIGLNKKLVSTEMRENAEAVSETIRWLAGKPSFSVLTYESYVVEGVRYHTKDRDNARVVQNSASDKGVKSDDLGFTLVNFNRPGHKKDKYVSVDQVNQVFYIEDPVDANWSVVLSATTRDYHDVYNEDAPEDTSWNPPPFCSNIPTCDPAKIDDASVCNRRENVEVIEVYLLEEEERMAPKKQMRKQSEKTASQNLSGGSPKRLEDVPNNDENNEGHASESQPTNSEQTNTTTNTATRKSGGKQCVCAMYKVIVKKARGKKVKVTANEWGIPNGETRARLQSYIGMLARTTIPIDIPTWPNVDPELKSKLWLDLQATFKVKPEIENMVLKSAGSKWRQFKTDLTRKYVLPFIGEKKKLSKPPRGYGYVSKATWKRFVRQRTDSKWKEIHDTQSERVSKRKYHHRLSRKGYIGLKEDEIKKGRLNPGEEPDRAIFWQKARKRKNGQEVDEDLAVVYDKINALLEKKKKGEIQFSGAEDVLTTALESREHSGRVRAVGGYITPKQYFNLSREPKLRITKAELMARDRQRDELLEKKTQAPETEIDRLKSVIESGCTFHSPMPSEKASFDPEKDKEMKSNPPPARGVVLVYEDDDCVFTDGPTRPSPPGSPTIL